MNLKLTRLIPNINKKFITAYVDVELVGPNMRLKGVHITLKGNLTIVRMPKLLTESGLVYTPFNFINDNDYFEFKKSLIEQIQKDYPLVMWNRGTYDINLPKNSQ
jgi:hypothetical protein